MRTRWECRICWYVYDPAEGDPVWQIEPATAFSALPEAWTCPVCEAGKEQFLRLDDGDA
jgi:rubredoxin